MANMAALMSAEGASSAGGGVGDDDGDGDTGGVDGAHHVLVDGRHGDGVGHRCAGCLERAGHVGGVESHHRSTGNIYCWCVRGKYGLAMACLTD